MSLELKKVGSHNTHAAIFATHYLIVVFLLIHSSCLIVTHYQAHFFKEFHIAEQL